jgi:crotonobetainyl-CoA:carnitine CoA-transferase CaiB-like acyl-CoA transferase
VAGPLEGVRVIDAGTLIAGPFAATLLGEFGAEVIKVEEPARGDILRDTGPLVNGRSLWWAVEGRNKLSVTLDLRRTAGQQVLLDLAARADVVIENFRPGTFERWGLGEERLRAVNPSLVLVRTSGFGQTGPYREKGAIDRIAVAFSGLVSLTGYPDRPGLRPGVSIADYTAGLFAAFGALLALRERDADPERRGQTVDTALYEPMLRFLEFSVPLFDRLGVVREREGNLSPAATPGNNYRCKDGHEVVIGVIGDAQWRRFALALGREDWLADPGLARQADRLRRRHELDAAAAEWAAAHTRDEALAVLEEAGVTCGPVLTIAEVIEDLHVRERGSLTRVTDPDVGEVLVPAPVPRLSRAPGRAGPAPRLGEHNDAVYRGLLGYSEEKLASLRAAGAV